MSEFTRQNQELAIQLSLLEQENECILERMEQVERMGAVDDEKMA